MVKNLKWRNNPNVVARLIDGKDITTLISRRVTLKPNEACAFIIDGRIGDIISGDVVGNIGGGIVRKIGDFMGLTATDRRMLFAITGPLNLLIPYHANLANGEVTSGTISLKVQIQQDDIPKLLNIFTNSIPLLDRATLALYLRAEILTRVLTPMLSEIDSAVELRSPQFQENFEIRSAIEMRSTLNSIGMTLLKAFVISNFTDIEKVNKLRADLKNATDTEGAHATAIIERIEFKERATLRRIECEINIAKAKASGDVTVEVEAELRALRKQEAVWDAELQRDSNRAELQLHISQQKNQNAMELFEQVQARKQLRTSEIQKHKTNRFDCQNEIQERVMNLAAKHGSLTPEVIKEFLKQQTAQKTVDAQDSN